MRFGNKLSGIRKQFGPIDTADDLLRLYDEGQLTSHLPAGCWWLARVDQNALVEWLEPVFTGEIKPIAPSSIRRDGGLLIAFVSDDVTNLTLRLFPACDAATRFAEARS